MNSERSVLAALPFLIVVFSLIFPISWCEYCTVNPKGSPTCNLISTKHEENVKVFTIATEENDGLERYLRSARYYGIKTEVLGINMTLEEKKQLGGNKFNLLVNALKSLEFKEDTIVLYTDGYDTIFTSSLTEIINKFKKTKGKIIFGAEHTDWPETLMRDRYPAVPAHAPRFLDDEAFIGYASDVYSMLTDDFSKEKDEDYFKEVFLDEKLRKKLGIQLDTQTEIFQNLNNAMDDVKLDISDATGEGYLMNIHFNTFPSIIRGGKNGKVLLNSLANYLVGTFKGGECKLCEENKMEFKDDSELPIVSVAIFVEKPVPFFEEFLEKIKNLNYPRNKINLFIHSNDAYHENALSDFVTPLERQYKSVRFISYKEDICERNSRRIAIEQAENKKSDYLFSVDADAHLDDENILRDLINFNRSFIAPVLVRTNQVFSNFWGALNEDCFYARSHDYFDIVKGSIRGMWNMPYVSSCYLIKAKVFQKLNFDHEKFDPDMSMCESLRKKNVHMYVVNVKDYGHLVNDEDFNPENKNPDLYMLITNQKDWEKRYLHPEYELQLQPNFTHKQPCPDVYWFPMVTERFCKDLIEVMENFGKWSDGTSYDSRLDGGYEAVPTRDIHMNQVGLEAMWLRFLRLYVGPLQETVYTGDYSEPAFALMNFVVRYRPDEQPFLRPHHDTSTYTINIALNRVGIDYQGGGCRFVRYNCAVTDTKRGWMLMHPGRLTHFHEGLRVTEGTRYIMVSFVNP